MPPGTRRQANPGLPSEFDMLFHGCEYRDGGAYDRWTMLGELNPADVLAINLGEETDLDAKGIRSFANSTVYRHVVAQADGTAPTTGYRIPTKAQVDTALAALATDRQVTMWRLLSVHRDKCVGRWWNPFAAPGSNEALIPLDFPATYDEELLELPVKRQEAIDYVDRLRSSAEDGGLTTEELAPLREGEIWDEGGDRLAWAVGESEKAEPQTA